jgi:hypothetical protein
MGAVRAHLAAHYEAFGEEAPWNRSVSDETMRRERLRLVTVDL